MSGAVEEPDYQNKLIIRLALPQAKLIVLALASQLWEEIGESADEE